MADQSINLDVILEKLRQEFVESASDQLDEIEILLGRIEAGGETSDDDLLAIQRPIHNIKGQGATFGFPLTGRVAHMLEDYMHNVKGLHAECIDDIRRYLEFMSDLIVSAERVDAEDMRGLFNALPRGRAVSISAQSRRDINVLLAMPEGLQRKLVANELLSCGFRVMRAYDSVEAVSVTSVIVPDIVFVNSDMTPFSGIELINVFSAIEKMRGVHVVLLMNSGAYPDSRGALPQSVTVIHKHKNFTDDIGAFLIAHGFFGKAPAVT